MFRRGVLALGITAALIACSANSQTAPETSASGLATTTSTTLLVTTTGSPSTTAAETTTTEPVTTTAVATTTTAPTTTASTTTTAPPTTTAPTTTTFTGPAIRLSRGKNGRPIVALTFDAGSDTGNAARILDILDTNHIRASFGVTGKWAEQNPGLFRRMAAGHLIINHTYDHKSWTGYSTKTAPLTDAQRLGEIEQADAVFQTVAGIKAAPYFRAPYGDLDKAADVLLGAHGYHYDVLYSTDSRGWQGATPDAIVQNCRAGDFAGAIIVMHVGAASRDVDALQRVIDDIRAAGLEVGPVSDLL